MAFKVQVTGTEKLEIVKNYPIQCLSWSKWCYHGRYQGHQFQQMAFKGLNGKIIWLQYPTHPLSSNVTLEVSDPLVPVLDLPVTEVTPLAAPSPVLGPGVPEAVLVAGLELPLAGTDGSPWNRSRIRRKKKKEQKCRIR